MNFGHKIAITYGAFVVFILSLVTFCVKQDDITLVSPDYYKKEIAYQEEIDKLHNTSDLSSPINIQKSAESIKISFPEELKGSKGTILFYRPSKAGLDIEVPFVLADQTEQVIPTQTLAKGLWVLKMNWSNKGKNYMKEEKIIL
ncbi:FixH family protein [Leadbetterella byssophila DSM 17132]|uniref:FixH family protein n=1 Tax=Leadbetterella byssophila (strain DSM 17132 / JCM 16389 / KACC 11308 / NBRC 106382 / 4M15) TaxID=649349 RepID=E4RQX5_LEAB4|nr:FixH family protein [Leadbetterella byssophila]ADQ18418.1 FixH family protein [Leadbetterella byssophila DSM 17132]